MPTKPLNDQFSHRGWMAFLVLLLCASSISNALGQDADEPKRGGLKQKGGNASARTTQSGEGNPGDRDGEKENAVPKPLTKYMGRRIAVPMSYHGIPWLNRPERLQEENPELMVSQLKVKPGMTVCDMGCGDGYYTMVLSKLVGPTGKVLAVDIQPEMLQELSRRCNESQIENVDMVLGLPHDPKLPKDSVDLILMVDVYHEFSNPVEMLLAMRDSLKPNGRIALVEFRGEDPQVPIKPEHKMTKSQIKREYEANGFKIVEEFDKLPWQHLVFLGRDDAKPE